MRLSLSKTLTKVAKASSIFKRYITQALPKQSLQRLSHNTDVYIVIRANALLHDNGRYFFVLLKTLSSKFKAVSVNGFSLLHYYKLGKYGRDIFTIDNLKIDSQLPANKKNKILIYDLPLSKQELDGWSRCIQIQPDISVPKPLDRQWAVMPYCMHPKMYTFFDRSRIEELRTSDRTLRLFFAGSGDSKVYSGKKFWQTKGFDLIPRAEVLGTIKNFFSDAISYIKNQSELTSIPKSGLNNKIILADSKQFYIPQRKWLPLLSNCDFFICPPGIDMPLCHNAIEAMAVGTIPLINYPQWFSPELEDLKNCISYKTKTELVEKINLILSMSDFQISEMRKNVINYYQKYLELDVFYQQLIDSKHREITLFFNTGEREILRQITPESIIWG
ncbi:MAG: hypothetical protein F6K11_05925 [Leptolyngbya sp. SIO3F4]|nr:hypothetical protein [Leptolyngbya sp. SIO3F4]